jgi:hypothetical protein
MNRFRKARFPGGSRIDVITPAPTGAVLRNRRISRIRPLSSILCAFP